MIKLNCWEYKKCGRELGGDKEESLGICPASIYIPLEGIHDGIASGRACWVVAGTMCGGHVSGTFADKYGDCCLCDFYELVKNEEAEDYIPMAILLGKVDARARLL